MMIGAEVGAVLALTDLQSAGACYGRIFNPQTARDRHKVLS